MTTERLGRVASIQFGKILVDLDDTRLTLEVGRNLPYKMQKELVVGDRVALRRKGEEWRILSRRKRENALTRMKGNPRRPKAQVIAANIDIAVIVAAKANPAFHPGLIDRYLILCRYGEVEPIICVNKVDLAGELDDLPLLAWYQTQLEVPVIFTSAAAEHGIDHLTESIRGKTAVLVGNSGVGKTSLVNVLLPDLALDTREVDRYGDGRHTTTYSGLYTWAPDSHLIDTPGIRSLEVSVIPKEMLGIGYPDLFAFAADCAFSNCTHDHEPDCAVIAAVERGEVEVTRYESYLSILSGYAR